MYVYASILIVRCWYCNIECSKYHLCPPLRSTFAVRETANVERNGGHKWVDITILCIVDTAVWGIVCSFFIINYNFDYKNYIQNNFNFFFNYKNYIEIM